MLNLVACASYGPVNLYDGPLRPDSEVAIIDTCKGPLGASHPGALKINSSDKEFDSQPGKMLPGKYELITTYRNFPSIVSNEAKLSIEVEAGKTYYFCFIRLKKAEQSCGGFGGKGRLFFWLEESETKKIVAGTRPHSDEAVAKENGWILAKRCKGMAIPLVAPGGTAIIGVVSNLKENHIYVDWDKGYD